MSDGCDDDESGHAVPQAHRDAGVAGAGAGGHAGSAAGGGRGLTGGGEIDDSGFVTTCDDRGLRGPTSGIVSAPLVGANLAFTEVAALTSTPRPAPYLQAQRAQSS